MTLFAGGEDTHFYLLGFHGLLRGEGGDVFAGPVFNPEAPTMIGTFNCAVFDTARRERRGAVRADIAYGKDRAILAAAQRDWLTRNFAAHHLSALYVRRQSGEIPDIENECGFGAHAEAIAKTCAAVRPFSVSYTHLTLPTIYSV